MTRLTKNEIGELYNLYHLARTALSGQACSKYDRKLWATAEFCKVHPDISSKTAYITFELCDAGLL